MTNFNDTQRMILGDCLTVLQGMPEASVDCVVTSPPYNLGKPYSAYDDDMPEPAYLPAMGDVAKELRRVMKPESHVFLNMGWNTKHQWRSIDVALTYRPYFELQNMIAWIKSLAIDGTALPTEDLKTLPALKTWLDSVGLPTGGKDGIAIRRGLCEALRADLHERTIGHMPSLNSEHFLNPGWEHVWHLTPTGRSPIDRQAIGVPYVHKDQPARFVGLGGVVGECTTIGGGVGDPLQLHLGQQCIAVFGGQSGNPDKDGQHRGRQHCDAGAPAAQKPM
jgi:site-specific DNA-methyltransferase (adenine-specific)